MCEEDEYVFPAQEGTADMVDAGRHLMGHGDGYAVLESRGVVKSEG